MFSACLSPCTRWHQSWRNDSISKYHRYAVFETPLIPGNAATLLMDGSLFLLSYPRELSDKRYQWT
jgi:hypothetical protein